MFFKNYEYFLAIVDEGGVSKAAEKLFISQPSLSKYLKRLEENIGSELFSRDSYPLRLTEAGELYLQHVKGMILHEKKLKQDLESLRNNNRGVVKLGITVWRSSIILPAVLPNFWKKYPNVDVQVMEGSHRYLAFLLEKGKVDFCIFHVPNNCTADAIFEHLLYERILFTVKNDHPALQHIAVKKGDDVATLTQEEFMLFRKEPFILLMAGQNIREITQNYLNRLEITPKIIMETSNIVTATNMVKAGLGVTFVPEATLKIDEQRQGLTFFAVDTPPLRWEVSIAYKKNNYPSNLARKFIDEIKSHYSNN